MLYLCTLPQSFGELALWQKHPLVDIFVHQMWRTLFSAHCFLLCFIVVFNKIFSKDDSTKHVTVSLCNFLPSFCAYTGGPRLLENGSVCLDFLT